MLYRVIKTALYATYRMFVYKHSTRTGKIRLREFRDSVGAVLLAQHMLSVHINMIDIGVFFTADFYINK